MIPLGQTATPACDEIRVLDLKKECVRDREGEEEGQLSSRLPERRLDEPRA